MTAQRKAELEQLFEQGYRAIGVRERHLGGGEFFVGENPTIADVALYVYPRLCPEVGYDLEGFPAGACLDGADLYPAGLRAAAPIGR